MIRKSKKIAVIVFSHYPEDPRVRREAKALEESEHFIDIFCLKRLDQKKYEKNNNISIYRSSISKPRKIKLSYIIKYFLFIVNIFIKITIKYFQKRYNIIHVHSMPDILVFIALIPKIFGAKIILDLHDPTPEVYMTKYNIEKEHYVIKLLIFLEKISIKFADKVITPNLSFKKLFISRKCPENKIDIIMNSPSENIFIKDNSISRNNNYFTIIYHGSIVERHGLYEALLAVKKVKEKIPNLVFNIYGEGDYEEQLVKDIKDLRLDEFVFFHGFEHQKKLVKLIQESDLGIIPNRRTPFTEINLPTRIFEYLCLDKPVIVPKTKGINDYFDDSSLLYFNPGDSDDLAAVIYKVFNEKDISEKIVKKGIEVYKKYTWSTQKEYLKQIINSFS